MDKKYQSIYSKNGLEVFVNPEDFWVDYKVRLNYEENWPKLTAALKIFSKLYYHSKSCFLSYIYSNPL